MLESFRIHNLRSLNGNNEIKIKPLTIFVGENSSGKSTYLRFYQLMKQSFSTNSRGPILWYSPSGVDFGSFNESLNISTATKLNKSMEFTFNFVTDKFDSRLIMRFADIYGKNIVKLKENEHFQLSFKVGRNSDDSLDIVQEYAMKYKDTKAIFKIETNKNEISQVYINDKEIHVKPIQNANDNDFVFFYRTKFFNHGMNSELLNMPANIFSEILNKMLFQYIRSNKARISDATIYKSIMIISNDFYGANSISDIIKKISNEKIAKGIKELFNESESCKKLIEDVLLVIRFNVFFDVASKTLTDYFTSSYYIAPVRATAERFYRTQNIAIDEVDAMGTNIPMILSSMQKSEKIEFLEWMNQYLGFGVFAQQSGKGHVSLLVQRSVTDNDNTKINLTDTGFGYSQIIPILVQLWMLVWNDKNTGNRRNLFYSNRRTLIIEQPELHLHPAMQARLMNVLISSIKKSNGNLNVIIETHSDTIINQVGHWIEEGKEAINQDDVIIYLTNIDRNTNSTEVTESKFDNFGLLENWPIGFFSADSDL